VALNLWKEEAKIWRFDVGMGCLIYLDVSSILFDELLEKNTSQK